LCLTLAGRRSFGSRWPQLKQEKKETKLQKNKRAQGFLNLCAILAEDKEFLTLLSECIDPVTLNVYVFAKAQVTDYKENVVSTNVFMKVKTIQK
jgi:hypothetical protein